MAEQLRCILQVSAVDNHGGAALVAWNLHQAYRRLGIQAWMAVGRKFSNDPTVVVIPNDEARSFYTRNLLNMARRLQISNIRGAWRLSRMMRWLAEPQRQWDIRKGIEDFYYYRGSWWLLSLLPDVPDIVHCHNLHGRYFDLRVLPWLSQQVPTILTLHDAWLLSGHCAHSFDCERWKTGCGQCPDLTIYPAIKRDATAYNWQRKREIYARSRLYVATPSRWLMQKVEQSILAPAIVEARVIPNGVDLTVFHPSDQREARAALGIPQEAKMLFFTANGIRRNIWKDYQTLRTAVGMVAERLKDDKVVFIALGEDAPPERIGRAVVQFIPYQSDPKVVAAYYQAADVYMHAARADTFPNTVLESLACGVPVVATAVGGIPEQVKGMEHRAKSIEHGAWGTEEATGILVQKGDAEGMAEAIVALLADDALRRRLRRNAAEDARRRFDLNLQVEAYLKWYEELAVNRSSHVEV